MEGCGRYSKISKIELVLFSLTVSGETQCYIAPLNTRAQTVQGINLVSFQESTKAHLCRIYNLD